MSQIQLLSGNYFFHNFIFMISDLFQEIDLMTRKKRYSHSIGLCSAMQNHFCSLKALGLQYDQVIAVSLEKCDKIRRR